MTFRNLLALTALVIVCIMGVTSSIELHMKYSTEVEVEQKENNVHTNIVHIIKRDGGVPEAKATVYASTIVEESERHNISIPIILSIMYHESKFKERAINPTGGVGLMQIVSSVHKIPVSLLLDPIKNIRVGSRILSGYMVQSKNLREALRRYNGSLGTKSTYPDMILRTSSKYHSEIYKETI